MKARERGAVIINVDPHYARTSAVSDIHVPIRAGSDIAFLGGLIRHIIETESYFKEYVVHYTNAATIINEDFRDTEDLGGYFSGFDPETGTYDRDSWRYEGERGRRRRRAGREHSTQAFSDRTGAGMETEGLRSDPTLQHPRCVFQILTPPLRALHARDGRARLRDPAGALPEGRRHADRQLRARAHDDAHLRRRLDAALHGRADDPRRRDRPAAAGQHRPPGRRASWRCAGTPRSRARATSRRSTTSCPATCRCRGRARGTSRSRTTARPAAAGAAGGRTSTSTRSRC